MSIKVIKAGLLTTIQDLGRSGYQQYGVVVGGAMDFFALRVANLLVDNDENAAGIEVTLIGPHLLFETETRIAICGGDLSAKIDGIPVPLWRPILLEKNSLLTFRSAIEGCRAYIAVAGGIEVNPVMASRSTYIRGAFGGFEGRALHEGDSLTVGKTGGNEDSAAFLHSKPFYAVHWFVSHDILPHYGKVVRIMRGREFSLFTKESQRDLFKNEFRLSSQSDRMGYRLEGSKLQLKEPLDLISEAVTFGTIQVPPGGNPILLMADRQTTGGYPRIAQVATVDLPILAQVKPGESVSFVEIDHREAEEIYLQQEQDLRAFKLGMLLKRKRGDGK